MKVIKRNGESQIVSFEKVISRISNLCKMEPVCDRVDPIKVAQQVCSRIYDKVKTTDLDELAAQICISLITTDLQYATLASRIIISNSHKNTSPSFSETIYILYNMMIIMVND